MISRLDLDAARGAVAWLGARGLGSEPEPPCHAQDGPSVDVDAPRFDVRLADDPAGPTLRGPAGARALLVSHWPVRSDAAVALTTRAIARLKQDTTIGRSSAMQHAMLSVIADRSIISASHPQVWAPFVVVGAEQEPSTAKRCDRSRGRDGQKLAPGLR